MAAAAKATGWAQVAAEQLGGDRDGGDADLADSDLGAGVLGEGGVGLSAGQRQRLALTRTLARDVSVVLLDEPTAHLDAQARERVIAAVTARAEAGATVVVAAHRSEWLDVANRIVDLGTTVTR